MKLVALAPGQLQALRDAVAADGLLLPTVPRKVALALATKRLVVAVAGHGPSERWAVTEEGRATARLEDAVWGALDQGLLRRLDAELRNGTIAWTHLAKRFGLSPARVRERARALGLRAPSRASSYLADGLDRG